MAARSAQAAPGTEAAATAATVVIKKYANRRLYNTEASSYVTLEDLAGMVRAGRNFIVFDAKSGEDITRSVLTQIIVEEESKGRSLLPETFLRQLIGFYGDSLQSVLPRYLEFAMAGFSRQQEQMRRSMETTIGGLLPLTGGFPVALGLEEVGKQNMAMLERAMSLFAPFRAAEPAHPAAGDPPGAPPDPHTLEALEREVEALKRQLEALRQGTGDGSRSG
jgi:polyhydroxyalkanoate synthesis repressor PhaR